MVAHKLLAGRPNQKLGALYKAINMNPTNSPSYSILLYGPRGCGKSLVASANFGEIQKTDPVWITVSIVASEVLQDPFSKLKAVFKNIEQYGINGILIEDIDVFCVELRKHANAYIFLLDKIKHPGERQFIIATTRKPEVLTPEELDSFQDMLPVLYPDEAGRREILQIHSSKANLNLNLDIVAKQTEWWSGEEIKGLVDQLAKAGRHPSTTLIVQGINHMGQRVNQISRAQRTRELLDFTKQHCTHSSLRDDVLSRFSGLAGVEEDTGATSPLQIHEPFLRNEVERALRNMNIENVDLAIFQLAKLFENELKSFLKAAQQKGAIKLGPKDMRSLSSMIDIVTQNGVVKKGYHLDLLREQRNERAHDKAPNKAERERLLEHAPFLRDLYIEYIMLFNEEKHKLENG